MQLHPLLEPEVGSSLEYEYSVTKSPLGGYSYVKWWYVGPILRANPCEEESENSRVVPKGATPMFPSFPIFLGLPIRPSSGFQWSDRLPSEGAQKYRLCLAQ